MKEITLSFNGQTITVQPNEEGLYNLNHIANKFDLREPNQWRNAQKRVLLETANLQALRNDNQRQGEAPVSLFATQSGLYAYAMWADPTQEFFVAVVNCFTAVTNGDLEGAAEIASEVVQVREGLRQGNTDLCNTMVDHYAVIQRKAIEYPQFAASVHRMVHKLATNKRMKQGVKSVRDELVKANDMLALSRMSTLYGMYLALAEDGYEYTRVKTKLEAFVDKKGWFEKRIK